ncbi:hypothetical protein C9374_001218 [Naegleria lovaniensis]|uniref:Ion transport domain-containing protein n=1 Tax=Naegleria lovaniensis TaxID=51637 RepID=A0AA88KN50_NAELO|nr:uncharacterized protein C9374_001218 [Naegleria lovaniensis]KAG2387624.1 hypothetical protein C9374_001218 [Naegleria lovaniensis]
MSERAPPSPTASTTSSQAASSNKDQQPTSAKEASKAELRNTKLKFKQEEAEKKKALEVIENSRLFRSRRTINIIRSIPQNWKERTWRQKLYLILEHPRSSYVAMIVTIITSLLTVIQTLCLVLRSFPFFFPFEVMWLSITGFLSLCFMTEYFLRMAAYVRTWGDFRHFVKAPANLIDAASFVPFYFDLIIYLSDSSSWVNINLQVLTVFRVLKLLRLIKLTRYSAKFQLLIVSLRRSLDMLLSLAVLVFMGALICSTLVYYAERGKYDLKSGQWLRPDGTSSPFSNILVCMWYSIVTIATVGYGDMAPITPLGRIIAIFTILSGVIIVALPSMVVGGIYSKLLGEYELMVSKRKLEGDNNIEDEEFDVIDNLMMANGDSSNDTNNNNETELLTFDEHPIQQQPATTSSTTTNSDTTVVDFTSNSGGTSFHNTAPFLSSFNPFIHDTRDLSIAAVMDRQDSIIKSCAKQLNEMKRLAQEVKNKRSQ